MSTSNSAVLFQTPTEITTVHRSAGPSENQCILINSHSKTLCAETKVWELLSLHITQKHDIQSNQQAVKQSFIITPLQQSVSAWCKADLPVDLSSTWLSVPPLAFSLTSLCPSPHLSIHHLGGQRKSINPSTSSFTPRDWWEREQEMGEPWIFHNIFVTVEKKNCIALQQTYAHSLHAALGSMPVCLCVFIWLSEGISWSHEKVVTVSRYTVPSYPLKRCHAFSPCAKTCWALLFVQVMLDVSKSSSTFLPSSFLHNIFHLSVNKSGKNVIVNYSLSLDVKRAEWNALSLNMCKCDWDFILFDGKSCV